MLIVVSNRMEYDPFINLTYNQMEDTFIDLDKVMIEELDAISKGEQTNISTLEQLISDRRKLYKLLIDLCTLQELIDAKQELVERQKEIDATEQNILDEGDNISYGFDRLKKIVHTDIVLLDDQINKLTPKDNGPKRGRMK